MKGVSTERNKHDQIWLKGCCLLNHVIKHQTKKNILKFSVYFTKNTFFNKVL